MLSRYKQTRTKGTSTCCMSVGTSQSALVRNDWHIGPFSRPFKLQIQCLKNHYSQQIKLPLPMHFTITLVQVYIQLCYVHSRYVLVHATLFSLLAQKQNTTPLWNHQHNTAWGACMNQSALSYDEVSVSDSNRTWLRSFITASPPSTGSEMWILWFQI